MVFWDFLNFFVEYISVLVRELLSNIHCLSVNCTKINHSRCRSWFDLLYNWPPNSDLLCNNSLLELIYFLTIELKENIMVLNYVTKFHNILIKTIRLRERKSLDVTYGRTGVTLNAPAIVSVGHKQTGLRTPYLWQNFVDARMLTYLILSYFHANDHT